MVVQPWLCSILVLNSTRCFEAFRFRKSRREPLCTFTYQPCYELTVHNFFIHLVVLTYQPPT
ncbi:hypothetical protein HanRHA438_Chr03g0105441 [Helianthus annuus]|nr:hypothetical protein HanIR_Chr03g0102891 [Helianthus annuus]KAJ0934265.1 hypothetical protein HanRHA438_Chr03g0105441 [Helianthus annuus]